MNRSARMTSTFSPSKLVQRFKTEEMITPQLSGVTLKCFSNQRAVSKGGVVID